MKNFTTLAQDSRIWIYQSKTEFSIELLEKIKQKANAFVEQWTSHGNTMDAAVELFYNRFVIIAVDEKTAPASGCGIDKSVRFIQDLEKEFTISLLDRMQVAYIQDQQVLACSINEFEQLFHDKKVNEQTIIFNNLIQTKNEMDNAWKIPVVTSWLMSRLNTVSSKA